MFFFSGLRLKIPTEFRQIISLIFFIQENAYSVMATVQIIVSNFACYKWVLGTYLLQVRQMYYPPTLNSFISFISYMMVMSIFYALTLNKAYYCRISTFQKSATNFVDFSISPFFGCYLNSTPRHEFSCFAFFCANTKKAISKTDGLKIHGGA